MPGTQLPMKAVLLVDDDEAFRSAMGRLLERQGYEVKLADGFDEAMNVLGSASIDVLISDVRMPGRSGLELLETVRSQKMTFPVLLLVTEPGEITNEDARRKGADALLSKPFNSKALASLLGQLLASPHRGGRHDFIPAAGRKDLLNRLSSSPK